MSNTISLGRSIFNPCPQIFVAVIPNPVIDFCDLEKVNRIALSILSKFAEVSGSLYAYLRVFVFAVMDMYTYDPVASFIALPNFVLHIRSGVSLFPYQYNCDRSPIQLTVDPFLNRIVTLFLYFFEIRVIDETGCLFTLRDPTIPNLICSPHIISVMKTEEHSSRHL